MQIAMVGSGYVGLVSGACFAETGAQVTCADIDTSVIGQLRAGQVPIFEPGLAELIERNRASGRLSFTDDVAGAIAGADVVGVAVGTPALPDGGADLRAVEQVAELVARHASRELVLVIKSTVPVGTHQRVQAIVASAAHPVHVVSSPEFLKEGAAVDDFLRPDRVVIGLDADDEHARNVVQRLYHPVTMQRNNIVWMDPASAELTKYVANTMLAMRISFMNEVAGLCEVVGADIHQVRLGIGSDARIGPRFLYAGPGYGGACMPKDVPALVHTARSHGVELELAAATHKVNERQKGVLARKLTAHFGGNLSGKVVGVWGLSFKPLTDDVRESPALALIDALLAAGASVRAHDPAAMNRVRARYGRKIELVSDSYAAARGADALVLVTEWRQYQNPNFEELQGSMRQKVLVDGRNIWSGYGLKRLGFAYYGVGVGQAT